MNNNYCHGLLFRLFLAALCLLGVTTACQRAPSPPNTVPKVKLEGVNAPNNVLPPQPSPSALPAPATTPLEKPQPSSSSEWLPRDGRVEVVSAERLWNSNNLRKTALDTSKLDGAKATAGQPTDARNFIVRASNDGAAEEQAALYVASKTTNNDIRNYAAQLGRDHGKANQQLRKIAAKRGIDTPSDPEGVLRDKLDRLRQMDKGPQLDQTFLQEFGVTAHADAIALFEQQAGNGEDQELKKFAGKVLPKLRNHYSQAKELQQKHVIKNSKLSM
jgi:putative membrane protein